MDFRKKAEEILIQRCGYSFKTGEEEIEVHLKEVWNEAILESSKYIGSAACDCAKIVKELKEKY